MGDERKRVLKIFEDVFEKGVYTEARGADGRNPGTATVYVPEDENDPGVVVVINNLTIDDTWMVDFLKESGKLDVVVVLSDNTATPVNYGAASKLRGMVPGTVKTIIVITSQMDVRVLSTILGRTIDAIDMLPEVVKEAIGASGMRTVSTYSRADAERAYNAFWEALERLRENRTDDKE